MRILRQDIGEPRRDAEDQRDEADQFRILPQQREEAAAGAQTAEKTVEGRKSRIRILAARELIDDERNKRGEIVARLLAAQRAVAAGLPIAHRGGDLLRLAKAHLRQPIERLGLARVGGETTGAAGCARNSGARSNSLT